MLIIVKNENNIQDKLSSILGYTPNIASFSQKLLEYKNSVKKKHLATEEIFSLFYDTTLSDLRNSVWVTINKDELSLITKNLKVLEVCEALYN